MDRTDHHAHGESQGVNRVREVLADSHGGDPGGRRWAWHWAEERERLFERFSRANLSAKGDSGLGLAICEAIVRRHGGHIDVESRPGEGSSFAALLLGAQAYPPSFAT